MLNTWGKKKKWDCFWVQGQIITKLLGRWAGAGLAIRGVSVPEEDLRSHQTMVLEHRAQLSVSLGFLCRDPEHR